MMRGNSDIQVELESLSKEVSEIPVKQVFTVPAGYFDQLPGMMLERVRTMEQDHEEEISSLSPLLAGLSKKMPMSVPEGYFSEVKVPEIASESKLAPVVSMPKSRFRMFAVAASVVAILGFGALLYFMDQQDQVNENMSLSKELPKVSEKEMDEFLSGFPDLMVAEPIAVSGNPAEAEEMMRDIDEDGLKAFLSDQPDITPQKLN